MEEDLEYLRLQLGIRVRWTAGLSKGACQDHLGTRGKQLGSDYLILITCCETLGDYLSFSGVVKIEVVNS